MNNWIKNNWKSIAMLSGLIISGATGYTALLLELGELRSEVKYCENNISDLLKTSNNMEEKFNICFESNHKIFK